MRTYICTLLRMRTLATLFAAFAALMMAPPSFAQNGSSAQAELHINVIVMPVVLPPRDHRHRDRDRDRGEDLVTYDLAPQRESLSVTKEVRPMLIQTNGKSAERQLVQLTTIVAN
jgi:hypothetical protein